MFKLIKETRSTIKELNFLEQNCLNLIGENQLFELCESAQEVIGKVAAQLAAGKDPGSQNDSLIKLLAGLVLLANPDNRTVLGLPKPADAARLVDLVGRNPTANKQVIDFASQSASTVTQIKNTLTTFSKLSSSQKQEFIRRLYKLQFIFTKLRNKLPNPTVGLNNPIAHVK